MFEIKVVETKRTFYVKQIFPENRAVFEAVEKCGGARQASDLRAV